MGEEATGHYIMSIPPMHGCDVLGGIHRIPPESAETIRQIPPAGEADDLSRSWRRWGLARSLR